MVVVNQAGEIVLLNLQAEKQFGDSRDELVGQQVTNLIPKGFAERLVADGTRTAAEALAQQIGTGIELSARRKDGTEFPTEIMLSPLQSAEGVLVTAAIRDISVRKAAALERIGLDWPRHRKLPSLRRDLKALARPLPVIAAAGAGVALDLTTLPEVLGCMYVLEGATLGGQIIARNVARVLGLGPDNGAAFFAGSGAAATGNDWRISCATLEDSLTDTRARSAAVAAATATFRFFIDHLGTRDH